MASGQDRLNAGNNPILRILIVYLIRRIRERRRERQLTRGQRPVHDPPDSGLPGACGGGPVRRARRTHRVLSAAGIEPTAFCPEQARCQYPARLSRPSGRGLRGCTTYVPHAIVVSRQARSSPTSRRPSRCHPAKLLVRSPFRRAAPKSNRPVAVKDTVMPSVLVEIVVAIRAVWSWVWLTAAARSTLVWH
jgi:hypothetical protein